MLIEKVIDTDEYYPYYTLKAVCERARKWNTHGKFTQEELDRIETNRIEFEACQELIESRAREENE